MGRGTRWTWMLALLPAACLNSNALSDALTGSHDDAGSTTRADTGEPTTGDTLPAATQGADSGSSGDGPPVGASAAEVYAHARCAALGSCRCPTMPFADVAECEASMASLFFGAQDMFGGGSIDFECFDAVLAYYEASACETTLQVALMALAPSCAAFVGAQEQDEACVRISGTGVHADACTDGLACVPTLDGRRCRPVGDTSHIVAVGQPCVGAMGIAAPCEAGFWCDQADTQACTVRVGLGSACSTSAACETGYCDVARAPGVCAEKLPAGAACSSTVSCAPPWCEQGQCERALCADGVCQMGVPQACLSEDL